MERLVEPVDAVERLGQRQAVAIDLLAVGNDAGDGAQPTHDTHRLGIGVRRHRLGEKLRIELIGLAVHVEIGAREARRDQRHAQVRTPANSSST